MPVERTDCLGESLWPVMVMWSQVKDRQGQCSSAKATPQPVGGAFMEIFKDGRGNVLLPWFSYFSLNFDLIAPRIFTSEIMKMTPNCEWMILLGVSKERVL